MKLIFILFGILLLTAQTCQNTQSGLTPTLFGHWIHSFEEDKTAIQTYRPASYSFPLARSREGFELQENGNFIFHSIGAADGIKQINGTWKSVDKNKIQINFKNAEMAPYTIQLIHVTDSLLTLKKLSN